MKKLTYFIANFFILLYASQVTAMPTIPTPIPIPIPPLIPPILPVLYELRIDAQGGRVVSEPSGIDCDNSICTHSFTEGTFVALAAVAEQGYEMTSFLASWSGDCSGPNEACRIEMAGERSVTASFGALGKPIALFTLTVNVGGVGPNIRVVSDPEGINCSADDVSCSAVFSNFDSVALSATQSNTTSGLVSTFLNWTGDCLSENTACLVNMGDANRTVNANYSLLTETPAFVLPDPVGANQFYQHPRVTPSVLSADDIKPFGFGENGSDLRVQLPPMQGPIDIYLGVTLENDTNLYLVNSTNNFIVFANSGLVSWRSNHDGSAIDETIFSNFPWEIISEGAANFYVMTAPSENTTDYYLWRSYRNNNRTPINPFLD